MVKLEKLLDHLECDVFLSKGGGTYVWNNLPDFNDMWWAQLGDPLLFPPIVETKILERWGRLFEVHI